MNFISKKFKVPQSEEAKIQNDKELDRVQKAYLEGMKYGAVAYGVLIIYSMFIPYTQNNSSNETLSPVVLFVASVIIAPIAEEVVCRHLVYRKLGTKIDNYFHSVLEKNALDNFFINHGYQVAMILSGLVFITIHQMGFTYWPFYLFVSVLFCASYDKTQNLITPIIAHSFFNLINFWINMLLLRQMGG